jgi:polyribonucleotide 5'-hydroxyl-kinase
MLGSIVPSSALPLGMEAQAPGTGFKKVEVGDLLLHSVLALSSAMPPPGVVWNAEQEADALIESPIVGFIYVAEVDETKRKMTVLSPAPGKLAYVYLIMGNLKWMDT